MKLIQKFGDVLLYASLIVLPLILSVYDRLQGNIDSATLSRHLVFLSYKIPLDALTGFLIGLTSVVLLHSLPLKTQSSQWLRRLFFLACAVVSSFGTVWVTKALLKWVDPIHLHLDAATIERFRNSESTQFTVFVSLFLTLVWQRRRVPLVIQTELNKWWDTTQPIYVSSLIQDLRVNFQTPATSKKLDQAIRKYEQVFSHPDFEHTHDRVRLRVWAHAGHLYLQRFESTDADADLAMALAHWQSALELADKHPLYRAECLTNRCAGLMARYESTGTLADLDQAVNDFQEVLTVAQPDSSDQTVNSGLLALALAMRANATQTTADSDEAVRWVQLSLKIPTYEVDLMRDAMHVLIAAALVLCYDLRKDATDLDLAIHLVKPLAATEMPSGETRAQAEEVLGHCLLARYAQNKAEADLHSACELAKSALRQTPGRGARLARRLNLVGQCLHTRYLISRSAQDLEQASAHLQRAIEAARQQSPYRTRYEQDLRVASRRG